MRGGAVQDGEHLLDLIEQRWSSRLRGCKSAAEALPEQEPDLVAAVAAALGRLAPETAARRWPACFVLALVGTAVSDSQAASPWPAWWRACGRRAPTNRETGRWERSLRDSLATLGLAVYPDLDASAVLRLHSGTDGGPARGVHPDHVADSVLLLEPFGRGLLLRPSDRPDGGADCVVPGPGIDLVVDAAGREQRLTAPRSRPLPLAFDHDGRLLPQDAPLPRDTVWLLYPDGAAPVADAPLRAVAHCRMPLGWPGWRLDQVALDSVTWLGPPGEGSARRPVRGRARPRLVTGEPIAGLRAGDSPVYSQPPPLRLPAGGTSWTVEVRRPGSPAMSSHTVRGEEGAATQTGAFWNDLPRPLLGEYRIRVRGAQVPGMQCAVTLAEGLEIVCHPILRLVVADGLEACEVVLRPAPGMTAVPSALAFDPSAEALAVELVVRVQHRRFTLVPPRMRVAVDGPAGPPAPGGPLRLDPADFAEAGPLRVTLPGARRAPVLELVADGRTVQRLEPYRDGSHNLRRLSDTAAEHPDATLEFDYAGRRAVVARLAGRSEPAEDPWLPKFSR
ncbi:MAG TPA: hypothetical protein VGX23_12215 [Actinocrinis sp.]|nr:hypothetical protein [Actinocrinis sp.]